MLPFPLGCGKQWCRWWSMRLTNPRPPVRAPCGRGGGAGPPTERLVGALPHEGVFHNDPPSRRRAVIPPVVWQPVLAARLVAWRRAAAG